MSETLKDVRDACRALSELEVFHWDLGCRVGKDRELAAEAKPLLDMLEARQKREAERLLEMEKRVGCSHCGAQENEDCRIDRDGDCLFAEDARRLMAGDAWDGAAFMGPTRL